MINNVLNLAGENILTSFGQQVKKSGPQRQEYSDQFETFIRHTGEVLNWDAIYNLYNTLDMYGHLSGMDRIWPMMNRGPLRDFVGGSLLTAVGDVTYGVNQMSGDGATTYWNTGYNPSSRITDINNFTIGLVVQTDTNQGVDLGCTDGTNELSISARSGDTMTFAVGTASVSDANDNAIGHYVINVRSGTMYCYKIRIGTVTAVGNASIAGSLTNLNMFLGSRNASSTADEFSDKAYSDLWIYDGLMSEDELLTSHFSAWSIFDNNLNRKV